MNLSRRRLLISAAAALTVGRSSQRTQRLAWRGAALGGEASILLTGPDREAAEAALAEAVAEIARQERLFSLYREDSALATLNREGRLMAPAFDFIDLLQQAEAWRGETAGAFDIRVQPLWSLLARDPDPDEAALDKAVSRVGGGAIGFDRAELRLAPGTALTLNGIAQGWIADRVTDLLRRRGFSDLVVDAGELRLPGERRRRLHLPELGLELRLAESALAVSRPSALLFDPAGLRHHLFDPGSGASPQFWQAVAVVAPEAGAADALSTALAVSTAELAGDLMAGRPGHLFLGRDSGGGLRLLGDRRLAAEVSEGTFATAAT